MFLRDFFSSIIISYKQVVPQYSCRIIITNQTDYLIRRCHNLQLVVDFTSADIQKIYKNRPNKIIGNKLLGAPAGFCIYITLKIDF